MLGVVVAIAALVPLLRSTSQLPAGTTPAACVGGAQVAATDDSFVAVPVDGGAEQGQLYTFDSTSGAPIGSPITVGYDPVAMAVDTTWSKLYVVNQGGGTNPASVSVIDYENGLGVATTIPLPSGADPESIAVSPGGSHVVVADTGLGELSVINPQDDSNAR